jgi:hypothetical protein
MRVKNWSKFQHFKDRRPPWIKLYKNLLDDPDWHALDGDTAKALVMVWLVASEDEAQQGNLPDPRRLAFRLRTTESKIINALEKMSHWLEQDDITAISPRYQDDAPETETETETETDYSPNGESPPASRGTPCPHDSIIALYHEILCPPCPRVAALNDVRKAAIRARWRNELPGLEDWRGYFETVAGSPFLTGRKAGWKGQRPFLANIDFLIRPGTPVKVAEGKYHEDRP